MLSYVKIYTIVILLPPQRNLLHPQLLTTTQGTSLAWSGIGAIILSLRCKGRRVGATGARCAAHHVFARLGAQK